MSGGYLGIDNFEDANAVTRAEWYQNGFLDVDGGKPMDDILITFDNASRTLSLAPTGTSFIYYRLGIKYTESATLTKQILDESGLWVFYIGSSGLSIAKNPSHDAVDDVIEKTCLVAYVQWDAIGSVGKLMWEAHGMNMSPATHHWLHDNIGAVYREGMALSGMTVDTGGDLETDVQFTVSEGKFYDEDIQNDVLAIAPGDSYTVWYLDGTVWRWVNTAVPGIPISAGNRAAFNDAGSQTEVDNNDYVLAHLFATNIMDNAGSVTREYIWIQGQFEYNTSRQARAGADVEINTLVYGTLPLEEVIPVATIILQASGGNDNSIRCKIVSTEAGDDFVNWRGSGLKATGGSITAHASLSGLTADDHQQYSLADGTRDFTGVVNGVIPTADDHLATKKYVDDNGTSVGGSDTQIQYNDGGVFGGDLNFTFDDTNKIIYTKNHSLGYDATTLSGTFFMDWIDGGIKFITLSGATSSLTWRNPYVGKWKLILKHYSGDSTMTLNTAGYWPGESSTSTKVLTLKGGTTRRTEINVTYDGTSYFYDNIISSDNAILSFGTIKTVSTDFTIKDLGTLVGTEDVDWNDSDIQKCLISGNVTFTFSNQKSTAMAIRVQHASSAYTVTFPSAYTAGDTGLSAKAYTLAAGATKQTIFNILYDGSNYFIAEATFAA